MSDSNTRPPEQVVRDLTAWSNGDSSKRSAAAESIDVHNPGLPDGNVHTRDAWEAYANEVKQAFPDFHIEIEDMLVGGTTVMNEVRITGTHEGEFKGVPPTSREVEVRAMNRYRVEDGRVEEWYNYYDTGDFKEQLGLTFPDVIGQLPKLALGKLQRDG